MWGTIKAHHLLFQNLIDINPRIGTIKLNDQRMALMSVEALGLLRRDLVSTLSMERAKGFLLRYGWACGYNDAESIERMFDWESKKELILAGPALHTLEGVVTVEPDVLEIDDNQLYMTGYWRYSFEAQEHIHHFGYSNEAVCWMLVGFAKGYLEKTTGMEVVVYEHSCIGKKDDFCYFIAQTVNHCDSKHLEILRYFNDDSLSSELDKIYNEIKVLNHSIIQVHEINQQLTNLLLAEKSLTNLIEYLTNVINRSIVIEKGGLNQNYEAKFINQEDLFTFQKWRSNKLSRSNDQIKCYDIVANKIPLGKMVVIGNSGISKEENMIIENSLSIFSIKMDTERKIAHSKWKKKVDFFEELIRNQNQEDSDSLIQKASYIFEIDMNQTNRMIVIKSTPEEKSHDIRLLLNTTFPTIDIFMKNRSIIIILHEDFARNLSITEFLTKIQYLIEKNIANSKFYIGAGRISKSLKEIGKSYQDSFQICNFLQLAFPSQNKAVVYEQLDPIMLFLKSMDPQELWNFSHQTLQKLIAYDAENESKLIQTLKIYLDFNSNVNQTAKELNLSIPGLRYRLDKIQSLCEVDLKTGTGCFHCQIALQIYFTLKAMKTLS